MAQIRFLTPDGGLLIHPKSDADLAALVVKVRSDFARDGYSDFAWNMADGRLTYFFLPATTPFMFEFDDAIPGDLSERINEAIARPAE